METTTATTANRSSITNGHIIDKEDLRAAIVECGFDLYSSKVAEHLFEEIIRAGWDIESAHRTMVVESESLTSYAAKIRGEITDGFSPRSAEWVVNPAQRIESAYADWQHAVNSIQKNIYALILVMEFEDQDLANLFAADLRKVCFGVTK